MRYARIYPWRRTRRSRAPSNGPDAVFVAQFSAGYTTNMFGFDLRQGQVGKELSHARPVMLVKYKYLGHQFAPTTDPDLVKDRPLTLSVCCLFGDSILPVF